MLILWREREFYRCFTGMDECFTGMDECFTGMDECFTGMDECFTGMDECFTGMGECFTGMDEFDEQISPVDYANRTYCPRRFPGNGKSGKL
ncbi:hypothetical protein AVEN_209026-1 [Araneus ventricosus]|uniref:Uncharacterized protein n=1 Tax=Araneus ventricosus TaxID=182803 RepID=A0A4Y2J586_ARAVE|nr:hypothetical protein AVEN_209026-1 [Araneus ventricosus]